MRLAIIVLHIRFSRKSRLLLINKTKHINLKVYSARMFLSDLPGVDKCSNKGAPLWYIIYALF